MTSQRELDDWLCHAVSNDMLGIAIDMLDKGANPNAISVQEQVPVLFLAQARKYSGERSEMLELLLNRGADPQARDNQGNTLMHLGAMVGADGAVVQMLEAGVDPKTTNHAGHTPLESIRDRSTHQAAGRLEYALHLPRVELDENLTHQALFAPDRFENSPMDNCLSWKQFDAIVAQLEQNGEPPITKADLLQHDKTGTPYLARAIACYESDAVLGYLAKRGEAVTAEELAAPQEGVNHVTETLVRREKLRPFFTPDHWQGRSKQEMVAAYRNLSESAREHLGNFHQLVTQKTLQDAAQQPQRAGR